MKKKGKGKDRKDMTHLALLARFCAFVESFPAPIAVTNGRTFLPAEQEVWRLANKSIPELLTGYLLLNGDNMPGTIRRGKEIASLVATDCLDAIKKKETSHVQP